MLKVPNSWKVSTTRRFGQYAWTSWPIDPFKVPWHIFVRWDLQPLDWLVSHWQCQNTMTIIMFTVSLLLQRTYSSLYPATTQDTQRPITRTIKVSCLSRFLQTAPASVTGNCKGINPDRATTLNKNSARWQLINTLVNLYREARIVQKNYTQMANTAPYRLTPVTQPSSTRCCWQ